MIKVEDGFLGTVVVPAFQAAGVLPRALASIRDSVAWYRDWSGERNARFRIVVVDDHSTDDTSAVAAAWARTAEDTLVLRHRANRGAAAARNTGAAAAVGPLLWYLDDDDVFLPPHLAATLALFRACPQAGYARIGLRFDRPVHESWVDAIECSTVYNLCVRRCVHDFIGGFLDDESVRRALGEDVLYNMALVDNFTGARTRLPTVHHIHRPGNAFDRQYQRFLRPFPESAGEDRPDPGLLPWLARRGQVAAERARVIAARRQQPWSGPPLRHSGQPETIQLDPFSTCQQSA